MKKAIRFVVGVVTLEYSLVAACYMDSAGSIGDINAVKFAIGAIIAASMFFWAELDRQREKLDQQLRRKRRKDVESNELEQNWL